MVKQYEKLQTNMNRIFVGATQRIVNEPQTLGAASKTQPPIYILMAERTVGVWWF